jgi:hypothetical protein
MQNEAGLMKAGTRDRHTCTACGKRFVVVYPQVDPDEPTRPVPLACPLCHAINHVSVGSSAASASNYWAERLSG